MSQLTAAFEAVRVAQETYCPGGESSSVIELPMLALAAAIQRAWEAQAQRAAARQAQLAAIPKASPAVVVELSLRPKRRRG
jgi:hypothetical protein